METQERGQQAREVIEGMIHTMRLHHRIVEKRIDGLGVHHSQHRMLMKLSRMGVSASQKELAAAMDVSPACVARTLKRLDGEGLIRRADGADGRCNAISILPKGEALVRDTMAVFRQIDAQMFEGISPGELAALSGLLRRIQANLIEMEKDDAGEGSVKDR